MNTIKCSIEGDETRFLYDVGKNPYILNCDEIVKAQDEERWIKVIKDMLVERADMKKVDRRQLPHEACILLRDYQKLLADDEGLLFRKISPNKQKQLVLPLKLRPLAYSELNIKMGHLGVNQSMQLIRGRF